MQAAMKNGPWQYNSQLLQFKFFGDEILCNWRSVLVIHQWVWHFVCVCVCAVPFLHVAATEIGLLEGMRVDLYELLMIRQGDIRVTGVLTHPPHGHCVEEKC